MSDDNPNIEAECYALEEDEVLARIDDQLLTDFEGFCLSNLSHNPDVHRDVLLITYRVKGWRATLDMASGIVAKDILAHRDQHSVDRVRAAICWMYE